MINMVRDKAYGKASLFGVDVIFSQPSASGSESYIM